MESLVVRSVGRSVGLSVCYSKKNSSATKLKRTVPAFKDKLLSGHNASEALVDIIQNSSH